MGIRRTDALTGTPARRIRTGPLPRLSTRALLGPRTLESRALPGVFIAAFLGLLAIQVWLTI
jgi:hypothetical protein